MRKLAATLLALGLGLGLFTPATAQAVEFGPFVKVSKVVKDAGRIGILDAGDVLRLKFSGPVKIPEFEIGFNLTGANGKTFRLETDAAPYGGYQTLTENDTLLTFYVNLVPEEMFNPDVPPPILTYPLKLKPVTYSYYDGTQTTTMTKMFWGTICGRTECRPINYTKGDWLINKG